MEYSVLADELLQSVTRLAQIPTQKEVNFFTCGERFLLRYVVEKGCAKPSEISAVMGTSTARTARLLCVLEMKGYVFRRPDKADLRRIIVTATKAGMDYINVEDKKMQAKIEEMLKKLSDEDAENLVRIINQITQINDLPLEG